MKTLSRSLKKHRRALLLRYDDEDLHKLRVNLRRIRSLLKHWPGEEEQQLRRDLGLLFDNTNVARDWDTLAILAGEILSPEQLRHLQPWLEEQQATAHQRVIRMLQSEQWSDTLRRWKQYALRHGTADSGSDGGSDELSQALRRVGKARRKALSGNDDRSWHKLRIAIKDLRYWLEYSPGQKTSRRKSTLRLCRRLQKVLGEWHDTVVHERLLGELADRMDPERNPQAAQAVKSLRKTISQLGRERLGQAGAILQQPDTERVLSP